MKNNIKKILPKYLWFFLRDIKNKLVNFYPYHLLRYFNLIKIDYNISSNLSFGKYESKFFDNQLSKSKFYLEFGSGNSTILAYKKKKNFLTVESDKNFYDYMICKIRKKNFYFVDFGVVGLYSYPYFIESSKKKALNYSSKIFLNLKNRKVPDLVLIDGRYRVLVGLFTYKYFLKKKNNFTIIIDDYFERNKFKINREHYSVLKEFFYIKKKGRFGIANKLKKRSKSFLNKKINQYLLDPR